MRSATTRVRGPGTGLTGYPSVFRCFPRALMIYRPLGYVNDFRSRPGQSHDKSPSFVIPANAGMTAKAELIRHSHAIALRSRHLGRHLHCRCGSPGGICGRDEAMRGDVDENPTRPDDRVGEGHRTSSCPPRPTDRRRFASPVRPGVLPTFGASACRRSPPYRRDRVPWRSVPGAG